MSSASNAPSGNRDTLRYGATLPVDVVDPLTRSWNESASLIYSRPITVDAYGDMHGDLVDSWAVSDDRQVYRLTTRAGVTWHDGAPLQARDIAFSLGLMADPANAKQLKPALPDVDSIEVEGRDVVVTFTRPVPGVIALFARACVLPSHLLDRDSALAGGLNDVAVGTGPYRLVDRSPGVCRFEAHENHHFGPPAIHNIHMVHIATDEDRAGAVAAGDIDLAQVKPQHLDMLAGPDVAVHEVDTRVWRALTFSLGRPPLSDPRVRRALGAVIDRGEIVEHALAGYGAPQFWAAPPSSWASPAEPPSTSIADAEHLLIEAGWQRDDSGRWLVDGTPVHFTFCYLETETFRKVTSEVIARQFAHFGVAVDLEPITWLQYQDMDRVGLRGGIYDGIVVGWSGGVDPYDNLSSRFSTHGAYNRDGYSDSALDELLLRAEAATERKTAVGLYRDALEIIHRDSIMVPLANPHYLFACRRGLTGFEEFQVDSFYEFPQYAAQIRWADDGSATTTKDT